MKKLSELLTEINLLSSDMPGQEAQVNVRGVTADSRQVQPGEVFVAVSGGETDGHRYIPDAIRHGACAVVGTQVPHRAGGSIFPGRRLAPGAGKGWQRR